MSIFKFKSISDDYGHVVVENAYINHFMVKAPGDFVKVYLLGLKLAQSTSDDSFSNEYISQALNISNEIVINAWEYWEGQGIIRILPYSTGSTDRSYNIEFLSAKEVYNISSIVPTEKTKYSPDRIISARENSKTKEMFEYIKKLFGRELSQTEVFAFLDWMDDFRFPTDVVIFIIEDCLSRGKKDIPYLKQVAKNWFDAGIDSMEKANDYNNKHKEKWQKYGKILNFMRVGRQPTSIEEELLYKWFYTYNFSEEIILRACSQTAKTLKPSFFYIDNVLTEWQQKGFKTIEEIDSYMSQAVKSDKRPATANKQQQQKPSFNNFTNRTYDTKALKEQLLKKSRGELNE